MRWIGWAWKRFPDYLRTAGEDMTQFLFNEVCLMFKPYSCNQGCQIISFKIQEVFYQFSKYDNNCYWIYQKKYLIYYQ